MSCTVNTNGGHVRLCAPFVEVQLNQVWDRDSVRDRTGVRVSVRVSVWLSVTAERGDEANSGPTGGPGHTAST